MRNSIIAVIAGVLLGGTQPADASQPPSTIPAPRELAVTAALPPPPRGVTELKFHDMFALPVGPRGLEPSARLRDLDGHRVRVIGYMVRSEVASSRSFLLSPLPVLAGDEDESFADDIPASAVLVRVADGKTAALPHLAGLIRLTGVLHVGTTSDDDSGRNAAACLELDTTSARALRRALPAHRANILGVRTRATATRSD